MTYEVTSSLKIMNMMKGKPWLVQDSDQSNLSEPEVELSGSFQDNNTILNPLVGPGNIQHILQQN